MSDEEIAKQLAKELREKATPQTPEDRDLIKRAADKLEEMASKPKVVSGKFISNK